VLLPAGAGEGAELEQALRDVRQQLQGRTEELDAAGTTNRDLMV
jgi:hypothetical protein